jgi:hypothetical protein
MKLSKITSFSPAAVCLLLITSSLTANVNDGSNASLDILKEGAINRYEQVVDRKDATGNYVMELQNEVLPRALQEHGKIEKNRLRRWGQSKLKIAGTVYPKGISVLPDSIIPFILDGQAQSFSALCGLDDEAKNTTVTFSVRVDGNEVWSSGERRQGTEADAQRSKSEASGTRELDQANHHLPRHSSRKRIPISEGCPAQRLGERACLWSQQGSGTRHFLPILQRCSGDPK